LVKGTNGGEAPKKRIAIVCMSVAVVALLLAASALPALAASKKSSGQTTNGQTTNGQTTSGDTTNGQTTSGDGTVSPDATNTDSDTTNRDTLTNEVQSPSTKNNVAITLTEDSRHAKDGPANGVIDQLPSGFKIQSIKAPDFNCSGKGSNTATCDRNSNYNTAKIKIVAKAPKSGNYKNKAQDTYGNNTSTDFKVK
jgi:hypothetical protein